MGEEVAGRSVLDDAPGVHDDDLVGVIGHDTEIVGDKDHRHRALALLVGQQVEYLGLDGHIEPGGRLVGEQQPRSACEGDGDHHALAHATGKLVGIDVHPSHRIGDSDGLEERDGGVVCRFRVEPEPLAQTLCQLPLNPEDRVQGGHRVLEDHRDLSSPDVSELALGEAGYLVAREPDGPGVQYPAARKQAHDRAGKDGLTRAGLAHHAEGTTALEFERDSVNGLDDSAFGDERGMEILYLEKGSLELLGRWEGTCRVTSRTHTLPSRMSNRERSRSPI